MKTRIHGLLFPLLVLPALAILLPGCSKTDDVRLVLCKEVTDRLLATMRPIEWLGDRHRIRRPEYAVIHLDFTVSKTGWEDRKVTSECYFAYDTVRYVEERLADSCPPDGLGKNDGGDGSRYWHGQNLPSAPLCESGW
mgnify:CR=1 FL=1